ncbi:MAG: GNAT family N-acetyltransferase [Candidatus Babeliales bacterium]
MKKIIALLLLTVITHNKGLLHASEIKAHDNNGNDIGSIKFGRCKIEELYVAPGMRQRGIGSMLFHQAIYTMSHCEKIQWYSFTSAIDFYVKQGATLENNNLMSITPAKAQANRSAKPKYVISTTE